MSVWGSKGKDAVVSLPTTVAVGMKARTDPSVGAFFRISPAATPAAPGLFSIVTGRASRCCSAVAITRAISSVPPFTGKPMTMRTPRAGRTPCASEADAASSAGAASRERRESLFMACTSGGLRRRAGDGWLRSGGLVAHDTDLVAVGVSEICTVVVGMIVAAQAGRTLVAAAGGHPRLMGRVDRRSVGSFEADGDSISGARRIPVQRLENPELRPAAGPAIADRARIVRQTLAAQGAV